MRILCFTFLYKCLCFLENFLNLNKKKLKQKKNQPICLEVHSSSRIYFMIAWSLALDIYFVSFRKSVNASIISYVNCTFSLFFFIQGAWIFFSTISISSSPSKNSLLTLISMLGLGKEGKGTDSLR